MACQECNQPVSPCYNSKPCKDCAAKIGSHCVTYDGDNLTCSGISTNTNLNDVIKAVDAKICSSLQDIAGLSSIINVGDGAEIYAGEDNLGNKQLKTITSTDESVTIVENATTIDLSAAEQVNANYTEENVNSPAFIQNRNPTKTINSSYAIQPSDNNFVLLVNNGASNITITIPASGLPANNFFVGFIQAGTGTVTFTGQNVVTVDYLPVSYGQGAWTAIEIISGVRYLGGSLKLA